jgi:CRISPR-associated protein Csb2
LKGNKHAFILCESNIGFGKGRRGEITHVTVHAPIGFDLRERKALDSLVKVWGHGGHDIQLVLLGVGMPNDFTRPDKDWGDYGILAYSKVWISRTPFIPTRHPKATRKGVPKKDGTGLQKGSPEHDLRRLLKENGFPEPVKVEVVLWTNLAGRNTRWLEFKRERKGGEGLKAGELGYGFRIEFPISVRGPIALGYGAHFGLGLFVPAEEEKK